jgi:hypothetical protein
MSHKVYVYQHGSTPDFQVSEQSKWYVTEEAWEGGRIVNITIKAKVDAEQEAAQIRDNLEHTYRSAVQLGRRGRERNSQAQQEASRTNGAKGGRPRKSEQEH